MSISLAEVNTQENMFSFAEKAREAVLNYDVSGLSENVDTIELIGSIIGENADVFTCSKIKEVGLRNLISYSVNQLIEFGLNEDEAVRLHSTFLLVKRILAEKKQNNYVIRSPRDSADYLMDEMRSLNQEHFVALFLNTKNQVIKKKTVFIGSLNASIVHPREVFREAVSCSAGSIIVAHNHPSGDPSPSQEDIHVTRRLVESGRMIGVEILDMLVIGDGKFVSLKEKGYING